MAEQQKTIFDEYASITYSIAQQRLGKRFGVEDAPLPDVGKLRARRAFDSGDHWQNGDGFIGQLPTGEGANDRLTLLQKAFSPEDVISEVLDTHVENVLGNEPIITLGDGKDSGNKATLDAINIWWEKRENTKLLAKALRAARRESSTVLRAFIPSGMIDGEGKISAKTLEEALSKIWFRHEPIERGGVLVDEATATELGLVLYRMPVNGTEVSLCEYSYIDEEGQTVWGTASAHQGGAGAEQAEPLQMNGLLPIYQMNAKALITESVCQAQRAVNLSGTMLTRNNNLAGSRERLAVGVQPPGYFVDELDENNQKVKKFVSTGPMQTGPATFNFLSAQQLFDEEGVAKALANPNIIFTDPVPIDSFTGTSEHWRTVILSKAKQRHLLLADDATASGRSRIEARKEFQASLNESKQLIDAAGRWMVEVALHIAAHFIGQKGAFLGIDATFDAQISTIELTPEEISQIREDYKAGLIDLETALTLRGFKNVEKIIERVKAEKPKEVTPSPVADAAGA